jgi:hypothetical protein
MASGKTGKIYRFSRIDGGKSFPVPIPEFLQILKKTVERQWHMSCIFNR